jgi:3-mercaptopyruvate sulfurtransferase SseA
VLEAALKEIGNQNTKVYDGSFEEWEYYRKQKGEVDYSKGAIYMPVPPC